MVWVPLAILAVVTGAAILTDLAARRIPNGLILAGLAAAMLWHLSGPSGAWSFDADSPGTTGATGCLFGGLALLAAFLPFYALGVMGAGDVKLMAFVGAVFGARLDAWSQLLGVSLTVLTAGGVLSVARMFAARSAATVAANLRVMLAGCVARATGQPGPVFDARSQSADRMPFALAIAAGSLFYAVGKGFGWIRML